MIKSVSSAFSFLLVASVLGLAQTSGPALNWNDSARDVYVDNELDRAAQVLVCDSPSRLALISSKFDRALIIEVDQRTVSSVEKNVFSFKPDRTSATSSSDMAAQKLGGVTRIDGPIYAFAAEGKVVVIRSHAGATGELTLDKLWEAVPVWRAVMENYRANQNAVTGLKACHDATTITLLLGTWCPDSKNYGPRLIRALRDAGNQKLQLKLIGIDNQFRQPVNAVQPRQITNVPTIIVEQNGREIGRIVETPASKTIEEDLAAILAGRQLVHAGRWEHGPKLASGVYSYRDHSGKELGREDFELFSTSKGGHMIHSRITAGGLTTEVFQEIDSKRKPSFAEITKIRGIDRTRTRFSFDGDTMTARMRGSVSGVIAQTIEVPSRFFLSTPSVACEGWAFGANPSETVGYFAPREFEKAMGTLSQANWDDAGEETVRVAAGEFQARHIKVTTGLHKSEWWLHGELGIPVRGLVDEVEYVLVSLTLSN